MNVKAAIRSLPVLGRLSYLVWPSKHGYAYKSDVPFSNSTQYWETRYAHGGSSGAGSYNRLAEFKAEVINEFVDRHEMDSVIEFGCGDGAQLELAKYPSYIGVDVSQTILAKVRQRYSNDSRYRFLHTSEVTADTKADLGLSLDVVYHLVEDEIYGTYMRQLFDASRKAVIIYASNKDEPGPTVHVRHRKFTDWVEKNRPDFLFMNHIPNRYPEEASDPDNTSFADFYVFRSTSW